MRVICLAGLTRLILGFLLFFKPLPRTTLIIPFLNSSSISSPISLPSKLLGLTVCGSAMALAAHAWANEGQWQPHQLTQLKAELKQTGLTLNPEKLADLHKHPMSAVVFLNGCTASFVSNAGLLVTNHHCGYDAIQRNSSAAHNYIADGFLAKTRAQELPAGPNVRVMVTDKVENVTPRVLAGLHGVASDKMSGRQRHQAIEQRIKTIIAECEADKAYRCSVPAFHRGLEYFLIRQLMLRDVRLVYAPSDKIGEFGGAIDNFEWPRHTGDFSFLRAYVGKDGRPADPAPENIPWHSKDFLHVSAQGVKEGDPVFLAGYPGRTNRYKLPAEIRYVRDVNFPRRVQDGAADLAVIAQATASNPEAAVRYASEVQGTNNGMKKTQGLMDGFARKDIAAIKDAQFAEFKTWFASHGKDAELLAELEQVISAESRLREQEFAFNLARQSDLLGVASQLLRLAHERKKSDDQRDLRYQARNWPFFKSNFSRMEQSFVASVDMARWQAALERYRALPAAIHPPGLDALLSTNLRTNLPTDLAGMYAHTGLGDTATRLSWMEKDLASIEQSDDAMLALAQKLFALTLELENQRKEIDGTLERVIPRYMQAVIDWKKSQGKPVYPDANGTLRVSYGKVASYSPRDGLTKGPFTRAEGILEKDTGKAPFIVPNAVKEAILARRYGVYQDPVLGTLPVNFLSNLDTTGGNSGSPVLNNQAQLIGLNFDSTYESITKDWYYDPALSRAIHVDIRYMLWVMQEIDHADNLLKEMTIHYPTKK